MDKWTSGELMPTSVRQRCRRLLQFQRSAPDDHSFSPSILYRARPDHPDHLDPLEFLGRQEQLEESGAR